MQQLSKLTNNIYSSNSNIQFIHYTIDVRFIRGAVPIMQDLVEFCISDIAC